MDTLSHNFRLITGKFRHSSTPCPLCSCAQVLSSSIKKGCLGAQEAQKVRLMLFHDECTECTGRSDESFCHVCKNMRLRHILGCLLLRGLLHKVDNHRLHDIVLRFGTLRELRQRSKTCVLCQRWMQVVESIPGDSEEGSGVTLTLPGLWDVVKVSNNKGMIRRAIPLLTFRAFSNRQRLPTSNRIFGQQIYLDDCTSRHTGSIRTDIF